MKNVRKLIKSLDTIKNMAFASGAFHNNQHEQSVEDIFLSHGLTKVERTSKSQNVDFQANYLKNGQFMHQPCGTTNTPDFLVKVGDSHFPIELKSSIKKNRPEFGASVPRAGFIYVFSSSIHGTSIVLGENIVTQEQYARCKIFENQIKELVMNWMEKEEHRFTYCRPRFSWQPRYNFFENTQKDFDDVLDFIYVSTGKKQLN